MNYVRPITRLLLASCLVAFAACAVLPQTPSAPYVPLSGQAGKDGQLHVAPQSTRLPVTGVDEVLVRALAAGGEHTLSLNRDGTVWAWGWNHFGQLGDGTFVSASRPARVLGLTGVTAIAGAGHSLALKEDGTVWAWGWNHFGQLGDGATTDRSLPIRVPGLTGVIAIAAGFGHTVALKRDGTVWAWGHNDFGQLGDGTTTDRSEPIQVSGLTAVTAIAAGGTHSLGLKQDGTVWAWGGNINGQLGVDARTLSRSTPARVNGLTRVASIATGSNHVLALKQDGSVWSWGQNRFGELGDGTTTDRSEPIQVSGLTAVTAIAAGGTHSLGLKQDGTVWAWGRNGHGQLGIGIPESNFDTPTPVRGLASATAIAAGALHSIGLTQDGTVWSWGYNYYGQLGDGTTTNRSLPTRVSGLTGVAAVEGTAIRLVLLEHATTRLTPAIMNVVISSWACGPTPGDGTSSRCPLGFCRN